MAEAISNYAKLMKEWETPRSQGGRRPDRFEEFPKMVYKARRGPNGGPYIVTDPRDENWSAQNYLTVGNREEEEKAIRDGWRSTPQDAIAHANALEDAISMAAAERAAADRRLSEKARREADVVDASTSEHVPEVTPELVAQARRGPGRPRKDQSA